MRKHAGPHVGVKASGGIRTIEDAVRVIALGVTRIGTSSALAMYKGTIAGSVKSAKPAGPDTGY